MDRTSSRVRCLHKGAMRIARVSVGKMTLLLRGVICLYIERLDGARASRIMVKIDSMSERTDRLIG